MWVAVVYHLHHLPFVSVTIRGRALRVQDILPLEPQEELLLPREEYLTDELELPNRLEQGNTIKLLEELGLGLPKEHMLPHSLPCEDKGLSPTGITSNQGLDPEPDGIGKVTAGEDGIYQGVLLFLCHAVSLSEKLVDELEDV